MTCRHDWTHSEIENIYTSPLLELVYQAATSHRQHHNPRHVQWCSLLSVKTGGCSEDCAYCPQAARYHTGVSAQRMLDTEDVVAAAKRAKEAGATRFCMGAAWRELKNNRQFEKVIELVQAVRDLNLEVCCSMGMMSEEQAHQLKEAGCYAYNHNLDTSESHYDKIISTREYQDRLNTLDAVRKAGITVCCGGIIGMGETTEDRIQFLHTLATMESHPESVPINTLIPIPGTPLEEQTQVPFWELLRTVATARILMPTSMVRLSAGRETRSDVEQGFLFLAGANSIHTGGKLLTRPTADFENDAELMDLLGLQIKPADQAEAAKKESLALV